MFERNDENYGFFTRCFSYATDLAALFNVEPSRPLTAVRQSHRANAAAETPYQYWLFNAYSPFLDHIIMEVDSRYDKYGEIVHKMSGLVPSVIAERDVSIKDVVEMYRDDLPSPMHTEEEIIRWKRYWVGNDKRPDTVAKALKVCDTDMYPNVYRLLQIFGTIAVTSCECERSGSVVKRLRTYLRASMGQEEMSGLAFMHIHHDVDIDEEEVINIFAQKKNRTLSFLNICSA